MMVNKKYKILLIQLPFPHFQIRKYWGNVPLAAGYLKSMAYKEGLLNKVDIEILSEKDTNLSSDSGLIDLIISKSPDILGFSLYNWNSIRSLFIAEEVKKKLPKIKIVVGGPEVTLETRYILDKPIVDIGCLGEGEFTFVEIIKSVLNGQNDYADIKGIFYKKLDKITVTPPREPNKDLDIIPSPYILGFINPKDYGEAWLENMRGCPFKCTYCAHATRPLGYFSTERIYEELKVILKSGVNFIHFVNGTFIFAPNFYKICEKIKEINSDKKISFFAFSYAEHINEKIADLLKECNFSSLEIGLQSVNLTTLETIDRKGNLKKFIRGINILRERKIYFTIDIIIGLPNETLKDFKQTLRFLKDNKCNEVTPLVLFLLPGTKLRKDAEKYGIKYQNKPPYLTIETPYISKDEIKEAITLVRGKPIPGFLGSLISYCNIEYPLSQKKNLENLKIKQLDNRINKVILELDSSYQSTDQLEQAGKKISRVIFQPFTVWFKTQNIEKDFALMKSFLLPIASSNPFLLCSIILETNNEFPISIIERIKRNISSREELFDFCQTYEAIEICIIFSWKNNKKNELWLKDISKLIPFFWSFNILNEPNWQREIANLFREKYSAGILIDFDLKSKPDFIVNVLKFLYKKTKVQRKNILFRNLAINYLRFIDQTEKSKDNSISKTEYYEYADNQISKPGHIESILSIDKNMNILSILKPDNETVMDLIEYQIKLREVLKKQ